MAVRSVVVRVGALVTGVLATGVMTAASASAAPATAVPGPVAGSSLTAPPHPTGSPRLPAAPSPTAPQSPPRVPPGTAVPAAGTVVVRVPGSVRFGSLLPVVVSSRPNAALTVSLLTGSGRGRLTVHGVTNARGGFSCALPVSESGTVRVRVAAGHGYPAARGSARYAVAGVVDVAMSGADTVDGVRYYRPGSSIQAVVTVRPQRSVGVLAALQYRDARGWHDDQHGAFSTDAKGVLRLTLRVRPKVVFRLVVRSVADRGHTASDPVTGPAFALR